MKKLATRALFALILAVYVASHFLPRAHAEAFAPVTIDLQQTS